MVQPLCVDLLLEWLKRDSKAVEAAVDEQIGRFGGIVGRFSYVDPWVCVLPHETQDIIWRPVGLAAKHQSSDARCVCASLAGSHAEPGGGVVVICRSPNASVGVERTGLPLITRCPEINAVAVRRSL